LSPRRDPAKLPLSNTFANILSRRSVSTCPPELSNQKNKDSFHRSEILSKARADSNSTMAEETLEGVICSLLQIYGPGVRRLWPGSPFAAIADPAVFAPPTGPAARRVPNSPLSRFAAGCSSLSLPDFLPAIDGGQSLHVRVPAGTRIEKPADVSTDRRQVRESFRQRPRLMGGGGGGGGGGVDNSGLPATPFITWPFPTARPIWRE